MADQPINDHVQKDIDNKEAMFKLYATILLYINNMGIDYAKILDSFQIIEQKTGNLPIFSIPEYLPLQQQEKLKRYLLATIVPSPLFDLPYLSSSLYVCLSL